MKKLRILLADDHVVMRTGLRALLERQPNLEVVGEGENGREAIELVASLKPDVVVMDVGMPVLNGIEATKTIVTQHPTTAVVILSMYVDESYIMRALKAGARGYLLKDSAPADLIGAIQAVSQNKSFFSPKVSRILAEDYIRVLKQKGAVDSYDLLTSREREILQLIAEGKANKEVAAALNISPYTVETHRSHILEKLNLHNPAELILYAVRKGLIS
ncbi:MAG TPA: response regulator transcription factor [Candidatus Acidoferrum sp.]|jgi:DNA-binding NarL/FixJ family response regulator|nr:response regulator transcription factor [Candidatus Acidoferrum sp.]